MAPDTPLLFSSMTGAFGLGRSCNGPNAARPFGATGARNDGTCGTVPSQTTRPEIVPVVAGSNAAARGVALERDVSGSAAWSQPLARMVSTQPRINCVRPFT